MPVFREYNSRQRHALTGQGVVDLGLNPKHGRAARLSSTPAYTAAFVCSHPCAQFDPRRIKPYSLADALLRCTSLAPLASAYQADEADPPALRFGGRLIRRAVRQASA